MKEKLAEILKSHLEYLKIGDVPYTTVIHQGKLSTITEEILQLWEAKEASIDVDEVEKAFRKGYSLGHISGTSELGYFEEACWQTFKDNLEKKLL